MFANVRQLNEGKKRTSYPQWYSLETHETGLSQNEALGLICQQQTRPEVLV